jgi:hypothetical protein
LYPDVDEINRACCGVDMTGLEETLGGISPLTVIVILIGWVVLLGIVAYFLCQWRGIDFD